MNGNETSNNDTGTGTGTVNLLQQALEAERIKSERLEIDKAALVAEFSKAGTYAEQLEIAKEAIKAILPTAIATLEDLISNANSESVRASLSKYVMDAVLSGSLDRNSDASVADLLLKLSENGRNIPVEVVSQEGTGTGNNE